ncbi:MAG: transcriptional regulator [Firmicutes bacterium]|nr:transcriptional regulator [Bacillota bacterium]
MAINEKIRMALAKTNMSEAELARQFGKTPQAFNQRMKTGKFTEKELEQIANIIGCEYSATFSFADGTVI